VAFYKAVAAFARAYAALATGMIEAGYTDAEAAEFQNEVEFFTDIRAAIKRHSGEELDIKPYEADMRHLINTYIQADPAADLGDLASLSLTDLIIKTGIHDAIARKLNEKGKLSKNAIAEGIINNVRKTIIRDQLTDPKFYAQMSKLLDDLIKQNRADAAAYEEFLRKAEDLCRRLAQQQPDAGVPAILHGRREAIILYNNLADILPSTSDATMVVREETPAEQQDRAELALRIDEAVRHHAPADWKGDETRERQVLNILFPLLNRNREATQALFEIIKNQAGY
jgi:type I restriction enzyme R subunit